MDKGCNFAVNINEYKTNPMCVTGKQKRNTIYLLLKSSKTSALASLHNSVYFSNSGPDAKAMQLSRTLVHLAIRMPS